MKERKKERERERKRERKKNGWSENHTMKGDKTIQQRK